MKTLKIILDHQTSPGIVAAKLWIRGGSRTDPFRKKGINQLLGSLLSRGCGPYDYKRLAEIVEGCGAGLNCETYEDGLLITLKCMSDDTYKLLPILGWMIKAPHLTSTQINLEKELCIQALKRQKENPFYIAYDGWRCISFSEGPYGHDPLGLIDDIKGIDRDDLISLSNSILKRDKTLVISGTLPKGLEEEILTIEPFNILLKEEPENLNSKNKNIFTNNKTDQNSTINLEFQETSQIVLMLGQATAGYKDKDDVYLRLLSCHLGVGMSSKLFLELREKYGVAYDVGVYHPSREITSPFVLHASTSEEKAVHTLDLLQEALRELKQTLLSDEETSLAKAKYRSQLLHATQTISQRAERKAHILGMGLPINNDKINLKAIESITNQQLLNVANKYLTKPLLSLCGPKKTLKELSNIWYN